MRRWLECLVGVAALMLCMGFAPSGAVRDEQAVSVAGARETWRLVWSGPVKEICAASEVDMSITCSCSGFAYGEAGRLSLVRLRGGREIDRMPLGPLFGKADGPGDVTPGLAYLQRWPLRTGDYDRQERGDLTLMAEIRKRPAPALIQPADYNRDGQTTEFLVQVGTLPCGKLQFAAVGVTKVNPRLHALGSAAHPDEPLIMPRHAWDALLMSDRPPPLPIWDCDDHGSEVRSVLTVSALSGVIRAINRDYSCPSGSGPPDRLIKETEW